MVSKRERGYKWIRRDKNMASVRVGELPLKRRKSLAGKVAIYIESLALSMDRDKVSRIKKAHDEVREGKFVPLDSI